MEKNSKTLSYLLRHGIIEHKLNMDKLGYVKLDDLLSNKLLKKLNFDDIYNIVKNDKKNRYDLKLENGIYYIRANQGHSEEVGKLLCDDLILEEIITPLDLCVHGTYQKYLNSIHLNGLSKMNRSHIHFANSLTAKSGIRNDCDALIYIDMKKAMDDGIKFYRSKNGVILSSGINGIISKKYFLNYTNKN